jgi:hypothetical protein
MPRARRRNAAMEQPSEAPSADTLSQSVKSRRMGKGSDTVAHEALPRLVIRRPRRDAATTQRMNNCRLRVNDSPVFQPP